MRNDYIRCCNIAVGNCLVMDQWRVETDKKVPYVRILVVTAESTELVGAGVFDRTSCDKDLDCDYFRICALTTCHGAVTLNTPSIVGLLFIIICPTKKRWRTDGRPDIEELLSTG